MPIKSPTIHTAIEAIFLTNHYIAALQNHTQKQSAFIRKIR